MDIRHMLIWPDWQIGEIIGEGSYGKVYKAMRSEYGIEYYSAIKHIEIPPGKNNENSVLGGTIINDTDAAQKYYEEIVAEVRQEIQTMFRLRGNTNIVSYDDHKIIEKPDKPGYDIFIRMELLQSLEMRMTEKPFTRSDVINMGVDICNALAVLSEDKCVHQDIKPKNIFVTDKGVYKIGDFGIAEFWDKTNAANEAIRKGTLFYMPPELYRNGKLNQTVDLYSLGLVMYRLLNGYRHPFLTAAGGRPTEKECKAAIERRMNGEALPKPSEADDILAQVVLKACAYKPEDRWQEPAAMRQALLNCNTSLNRSRVQNKKPLPFAPIDEELEGRTMILMRQQQNPTPHQSTDSATQTTADGGQADNSNQAAGGQAVNGGQAAEANKNQTGANTGVNHEAGAQTATDSSSVKPVLTAREQKRAARQRQKEEARAAKRAQKEQQFAGADQAAGSAGSAGSAGATYTANTANSANSENAADADNSGAAEQAAPTGRRTNRHGQQTQPKSRLKIAAIVIGVLLALFGAIYLGVNYSYASTYEKAGVLYEQGNFKEAYETYNRLHNYKDAEERSNDCIFQYARSLQNQKDYVGAIEWYQKLPDGYEDKENAINLAIHNYIRMLLDNGEIDAAAEYLKQLPDDYPDKEEMLQEVQLSRAKELYDAKSYSEALEMLRDIPSSCKGRDSLFAKTVLARVDQLLADNAFGEALELLDELPDDNDDKYAKIYEAKYGYVKANYTRDDSTTMEYLAQLAEAEYQDSQELYDKLTVWTANIVVNGDPDDPTTNNYRFYNGDNVYFHFTLHGGKLDEKIQVSYEVTQPLKKDVTAITNEELGDGETGRCSYTPDLLLGGTVTFNIYNNNTGALIGSTKIEIVNG